MIRPYYFIRRNNAHQQHNTISRLSFPHVQSSFALSLRYTRKEHLAFYHSEVTRCEDTMQYHAALVLFVFWIKSYSSLKLTHIDKLQHRLRVQTELASEMSTKNDDYMLRFKNIEGLYGQGSLQRLQSSHVCGKDTCMHDNAMCICYMQYHPLCVIFT